MCEHMAAEGLSSIAACMDAYDARTREREALRRLLSEMPEGVRDDVVTKVEAAEAVAVRWKPRAAVSNRRGPNVVAEPGSVAGLWSASSTASAFEGQRRLRRAGSARSSTTKWRPRHRHAAYGALQPFVQP